MNLIRKSYLLFVIVCICNCSKSQQLQFIPVTFLDKTSTIVDRGKPITSKGIHFLVEYYNESELSEKIIDSFVYSQKLDTGRYNQYTVTIYKETNYVNAHTLKNDRDKFDYGTPLNATIFRYHWRNGKFLAKYKIKNGVIVNADTEIILIDKKDQ